MNNTPSKYRTFWVCLVLVLTTLGAFWQLHSFDFVDYDDPINIARNPYVRNGFSIQSIRWAFFSKGKMGDYTPLSSLSHMLDCEIYGLKAGGHHMTNVLFHIANAILLFLVFRNMTGALWQSAFIAFVFALHPLRVESVAWITERKDVLCSFFSILAIGAYTRYARSPSSIGRYLTVMLAVAAALLSKAMAVTLPFMFLLLDYWPLERFSFNSLNGRLNSEINYGKKDIPRVAISRLLVEKIPFFIMSAAVSIIAYIVDKAVGAVAAVSRVGLIVRVGNALISYARYIGKMILPSKLAVFYPHAREQLSMWEVVVVSWFLVCVSVWVVRSARSRKYLLVGWLWYLGTLVPVIGLVQIGSQAMADRYTYLPSIGIFIMIAWSVGELSTNWANPKKKVLVISAGLMLAALLVLTRIQVGYWRNSITLFGHALEVTENNYVAHYNMGTVLASQGKLDEAIGHFGHVVRIYPNNSDVYYALGNAFRRQGKFKEAIILYQKSLQIKPGDVLVYNNLANTLEDQGKLDEAISIYRQALQLKPDFAQAHYNLGYAHLKQDNLEEAISCFRQAHQLNPDWLLPLNALARTLAMDTDPNLYDTGEAIKFAERAAELTKYQDAEILETLAVVFAAAGEFDRALTTVQSAIALAVAGKNDNLVNQLRIKLESYKQGKP